MNLNNERRLRLCQFGFTLTELLVVVAIVALILAIVLPVLCSSARTRAKHDLSVQHAAVQCGADFIYAGA